MQQPDFIPSDEDLEAAFNGALPETEQPEKAQEPDPAPEKVEPEEVAEDAPEEVTEAEIDYDLSIPMPDGREAMTIGQMKDRVNELERTESQLISRENEIMRQQDDLSKAIQASGGEIPPELREQMARQQEQHLSHEHKAMLNAIPEMAEQAGFEKVKDRVAKVFEQYGAADQVGTIMDHRLIKMANDLGRMQEQLEKAEATAEEIHKAKPAKGSKPRAKTKQSAMQQRIDAAKNSRNDDERMSVIDDLLTG